MRKAAIELRDADPTPWKGEKRPDPTPAEIAQPVQTAPTSPIGKGTLPKTGWIGKPSDPSHQHPKHDPSAPPEDQSWGLRHA